MYLAGSMPGPTIIEIDSFDDPRVDVFRNVRDADLRGRDDLFMAESELVLRRLMRTPKLLPEPPSPRN